MAQPFCTHCGNPLESGDQFCMKCGARAETGPPTSSQPVFNPPPGASSGPSKALLIALIVGISVLVLGGGLFLIWRLLGTNDSPQPTERQIRETTTQQVIETTEAVDTVALQAVPDGPTYLTQDQVSAATRFTSDALIGEYQGVSILRTLQNIDQMGAAYSEQEQSDLQAIFNQEIPITLHYDGQALRLILNLPNAGELLLDVLPVDLGAQEVYLMAEETMQMDFSYRVLTLPDESSPRLLIRYEMNGKGDLHTQLHAEFDVRKVTGDATAPTTEPTELDSQPDPTGRMTAEDYAPLPGQVYIFDYFYPSGEYGIEEVYIGQVSPDHLSSSATFISDEFDDYLVDRFDYVSRDGSVYIHYEDSDDEILWLPRGFDEGTTFTNGWAFYEILEVDASFDVNGFSFDDGIVRTIEAPETEFFATQYLAPGHGIVHIEYDYGQDMMTLIDWYEADLESINAILQESLQR